jgi:hypothetical protein
VQLWAYSEGNWYVIATSKLGPNGCQYFNLNGAYRYYPVIMVVDYRQGSAYWSGITPTAAPAGDGRYSLGTGVVTCGGCF